MVHLRALLVDPDTALPIYELVLVCADGEELNVQTALIEAIRAHPSCSLVGVARY